ncbi:MAG: helix-turn-helix transcriptional regulator [Acutalibacteraceae bacterium]|jgi:AraC-like DNA-binding protein
MLYNSENAIISVEAVDKLSWKSGIFSVDSRNFSALAFRVKGSGKFRCEEKEYFVEENEVLYLPQGLAYEVEYTDTEIYFFHFKTEKNDPEIEIYTVQNTEKIYKLFLKGYTIWKERAAGYKNFALSILFEILGILCENDMQISMPTHFVNAVCYINSHFFENSINIDKICKNCGICATTLRQLFKKYYNKTPNEYITDLRLELARNLISSNRTVEQAAINSGFSDAKYFSRLVKKKLHCNPKDFKAYGK